jgi:hypothetical protein
LDNGLELAFPSTGFTRMQMLMTNMAALAVAMLYYLWRAQYQLQQRRQRILCQRVASLLFAAADQIHNSDPGLSATCGS